MPLICLRLDDLGTWPVVVNERDELACADGVEWRFMASVQDAEQAREALAQLRLEHNPPRQRRTARADSGAEAHRLVRVARIGRT